MKISMIVCGLLCATVLNANGGGSAPLTEEQKREIIEIYKSDIFLTETGYYDLFYIYKNTYDNLKAFNEKINSNKNITSENIENFKNTANKYISAYEFAINNPSVLIETYKDLELSKEQAISKFLFEVEEKNKDKGGATLYRDLTLEDLDKLKLEIQSNGLKDFDNLIYIYQRNIEDKVNFDKIHIETNKFFNEHENKYIEYYNNNQQDFLNTAEGYKNKLTKDAKDIQTNIQLSQELEKQKEIANNEVKKFTNNTSVSKTIISTLNVANNINKALEGTNNSIKQTQLDLEQKDKKIKEIKDKIGQLEKEISIQKESSKKTKLENMKDDAELELNEAQRQARLNTLKLQNALNIADKLIKIKLKANSSVAKHSSELGEAIALISKNNEKLELILQNSKPTEVAQFVKVLEQNTNDASKNLNNGLDTDIIRFNTALATNTRFAKLANPYNENLALAYAINKISKNNSFATKDNSSLYSEIREHKNQFKYDNNLWVNIIAGKGNKKNNTDPSVYGTIIGYDKKFGDLAIGASFAYAKSKLNSGTINQKTNNYIVGLYSRLFLPNMELDFKASMGKSHNNLDLNIKAPKIILKQKGSYDAKFTTFDIKYGYIFNQDDGLYIKPFLEFDYIYSKNKGFDIKGDLNFKINNANYINITTNMGIELRKYFENASYAYVSPSVNVELYKYYSTSNLNFIDVEKTLNLENKDKKRVYFSTTMGTEMSIKDNLSININAGIKASSDEQQYNGSIGLRYKF